MLRQGDWLDALSVGERFDAPLGSPETTDYVYDLVGNLDEVHLPNGVITDYVYDDLNRLELETQFRDDNSNGVYDVGVDALLAEYDYDLLADGRRSGVTETDDQGNSTRIDWYYDNLGRLTREEYDSYDPALDFITDYEFDLVGNRLEKNTDTDPTFTGDPTFDETVTYTYDHNDRLLTETKDASGTAEDRQTVYEYDATQQTQKTVKLYTDGSGGTLEETGYDYNLQGRLSRVQIYSDADPYPDTRVEYEYDDTGTRVAQTKTEDTDNDGQFDDETAERTDYLVDHHNPTGYVQVLEEWVDGALAKSYTLGLDVIAQALASGAVHFFLYDGHGSTRGLVDATGQPLSGEIYRYDAYGNPIGFDPATALTTLLYSGEQLEQLTGLQYLRARYYDLSTGTFNRLDPFSGILRDPQTLHKYLYTHGDPLNGNDPSGMGLFGFSFAGLVVTVGYVVAAYFAVAFIHRVVCMIVPSLFRLVTALGHFMNGGAPPSTYWSPTANMPMSVPAGDPSMAEAQNRLDYIHRLRVQVIAAGDDIVNNRAHGYSVPGPAPLDAREWGELRSALRYARGYDDYGFDVALHDASSVQNPFWHGITLDREGFLGTDDHIALTLLVHEPMHNLFYWWLPYRAIGHTHINRIVGPYSKDNYFNDLVDYLKQSTKNGQTWWDDLRNNAAQ